MKSVLYVNGCSNTAGSELTVPKQFFPETDNLYSFGGILANRWNMELHNDAIPGQGNDSIYSQTVHSILELLKTKKSSEIFALIGFAQPNRKNFIFQDSWNRLCAGMGCDSNDPYEKNIKEQAYNNWVLTADYDSDLNSFSVVYFGLVNFFEKYKINYCLFNSSFGISAIPLTNPLHENNVVNTNIFNHMKQNKNWMGVFNLDMDFHKFLLDHGFVIDQYRVHHSHAAHICWADLLEDYIFKNNLMPIPAPKVPVSWGEVIDKITILEIKEKKITGAAANNNIKKELEYLFASINKLALDKVEDLKTQLTNVNLELWQVEDDIRNKESHREFDEVFIKLARSVYVLNDERAKIKKQINIMLSSNLVEEKSYAEF
jgi:hypothetical protein